MKIDNLIALRYFKSHKRNSIVSFLSITSIIGLMLGTATLILVVSVMSGFTNNLKEKLMGTNSDIIITDFSTVPVRDYDKLIKEVENIKGVKAAAPFVNTQAVSMSGSGVSGIIIKGIDADLEKTVSKISSFITFGTIDDLKNRQEGEPSPALTDFIFMVKDTSYMFLTGPDVIKTVTNEDVTKEDLGGCSVHNSTSGVAHFATENDTDCIIKIRELMSYLPQNNMEEAPFKATIDDANRIEPNLETIVPDNPNMPYDMKDVIKKIVDDGHFFEVHEDFAKNIVVGYARLNGKTIGIVANQPQVLAGALNVDASVKAGRFVRFCDAFNIPLLTFVDVPGFMPGVSEEKGGIIRHGAKLLYAYAEATVPKVTLITRKAYGGAYCVMSSKHLRGDINYAYPTAEVAVMGPEGAVKILSRKDIAEASDKAAKEKELVQEYRDTFANPYRAAELGYIDEIIEPSVTRPKLIRAFEMLANKRIGNLPRKHGNIPL